MVGPSVRRNFELPIKAIFCVCRVNCGECSRIWALGWERLVNKRMNGRTLVVIRLVAWATAAAALGAVIIGYDSLPAMIPVTRWTAATKSPLIALRVPLINLLIMGLIELLSPGLHRVKGFNRADAVIAVLLLSGAAKAGIEAAGIVMLPVSISWTLIPLVVVLSVGLGTAGFLGRELIHPQRWRDFATTRFESIGALAFVTGIVILNLPIVVR